MKSWGSRVNTEVRNGNTDRNPDPIMGSLRFNTDGNYLEIWTGSLWKPL